MVDVQFTGVSNDAFVMINGQPVAHVANHDCADGWRALLHAIADAPDILHADMVAEFVNATAGMVHE